VSDLIDTTEMYLRTVFELEEEGVVPLRARIAERLGQSGPTVSQTVARMERDGLIRVEGDRHLELTDHGRGLATRVMRKHRLAECLLVQVIGLDWELVHDEACRWEHVMSETVERRLLDVLGHPTVSPYGNPIPGLAELGERATAGAPSDAALDGLQSLDRVEVRDGARVVVRRLAEPLQTDTALMSRLRRAGVQPGASISVSASPAGMLVGSGGEATEITPLVASHVFVTAVG
jgi:DtxR family transcriptional regulator, iron-dependent repressor